jgi:hypothetical protein
METRYLQFATPWATTEKSELLSLGVKVVRAADQHHVQRAWQLAKVHVASSSSRVGAGPLK